MLVDVLQLYTVSFALGIFYFFFYLNLGLIGRE